MLKIILSATDDLPTVKLCMEHSLLSISKWESIHEKPFFGHESKTEEEMISYFECMFLEDDYPVDYFSRLTVEQINEISAYINAKRTATTFAMESQQQKRNSEVISSELIYYWLVQFQIPFHPTETWHISRLMTLVKVAGVKQSKPKKMNKQEMAEHYRRLNEQRRKESGSAG